MSLLANLLAFSSLVLLYLTQNITLEKEDRSSSANCKFFGDDEESPKNSSVLTPAKPRNITSKSLTKMGFYSNEKANKIDPKHRSLQRVSHSFNMKRRKYYF